MIIYDTYIETDTEDMERVATSYFFRPLHIICLHPAYRNMVQHYIPWRGIEEFLPFSEHIKVQLK